MMRALVALLVVGGCGVVHAAPLVYFALEGRKQGSIDAFSSAIQVAQGDVIEYRLRAQMAPEGTTNQRLRPDSSSLKPATHGLNSASISIMQDAGAAIQVDLSTPVDLAPGGSIPGSSWGAGIGAKPGMPTLRSGTLWSDLINIRPIHAPGVFTAHDEDILFTGLLSVAAVTGSFAEVTAEMGTTSGGGWFYGRLFYMIGPNYVSGHGGPPPDTTIDPLTHFTPLTLMAGGIAAVPEPGTCLLGGIGAVTLVFIARKRPRR